MCKHKIKLKRKSLVSRNPTKYVCYTTNRMERNDVVLKTNRISVRSCNMLFARWFVFFYCSLYVWVNACGGCFLVPPCFINLGWFVFVLFLFKISNNLINSVCCCYWSYEFIFLLISIKKSARIQTPRALYCFSTDRGIRAIGKTCQDSENRDSASYDWILDSSFIETYVII